MMRALVAVLALVACAPAPAEAGGGGARRREPEHGLDGGPGRQEEAAVVSERCPGCAYLDGHHPSCREGFDA